MMVFFYIIFVVLCVLNILFFFREEIWFGEDGSLSFEISDSDIEFLVLEQFLDVLIIDCEVGNCNDDQEEEMDNDNDDSDSEVSDSYDDSSGDMLELDSFGVEVVMFIEGLW